MDLNGVITAKSEIIRLKSGYAFLFTLYNSYNDATFHVFVQGSQLSHWRQKIVVNQCYVLSHLKKCSLKTKDNKNIKMCRVAAETKLQEVHEQDLFFMESLPEFESEVFVKGMDPKCSVLESRPLMISYKGCVTSVKNATVGVYELDGKILFYTTFLKLNTESPSLSEGFTVFICNAHLFKGPEGTQILVCCGLSSVEIVKPDQHKVDCVSEENRCMKLINDYGFNFSDLQWLENCLEVLSQKFYQSLIISATNPFSWNSKLVETLMLNLVRCRNGVSAENQGSFHRCIIQEFTSDPHSCVVTSQSNLGKKYVIQSISEILHGAKDDVLWSYNSKSWRCSSSSGKNDLVLAGLLCVSEDGRICIVDSYCKVPLMFPDGILSFENSCFSSEEKLLQTLLSDKVLVAVKDFRLICEEILDADINQTDFCICVNMSSIFPLFELGNTVDVHHEVLETLLVSCPHEQNVFYSVQNFSSTSEKVVQPLFDTCKATVNTFSRNQSNSDDALCTAFKRSVSLETSEVPCDLQEHVPADSMYISQKILICGKTLPILRNGILYQEVFVILLGTESVVKFPLQDNTELCDSLQALKIGSSELTSLTKGSTSETNKEFKPAILSFRGPAVKNCTLLFLNFSCSMLTPIHMDEGNAAGRCHSDIRYHGGQNTFVAGNKVTVIDVSLNTKFIIESDLKEKFFACLRENLAFLPKKYSVEDILHKRSLDKYDFLRGVIVEKWTEKQFNASGESSGMKKILVFVLKDCQTENFIRAYVSHFMLPVYGLIPGAVVELFGITCHCSKKGNLYLKSSGSFGLHVIEINEDLAKEICQRSNVITTVEQAVESKIQKRPFQDDFLPSDFFPCCNKKQKIISDLVSASNLGNEACGNPKSISYAHFGQQHITGGKITNKSASTEIIRRSGSSKGKYLHQEEQVPWNFLSRIAADTKFKSLCFILKILKVELFALCTHCSENTQKSCACTSRPSVKSKAFFLVDDGSSQNFVSCADDSVRVLLSLDHSEWHALTSHVQDTQTSLIYNHKTSQVSAVGVATVVSLFHLLCSSSLIRRQIVVECRSYHTADYVPVNSDAADQKRNFRLFAFSVYEPRTRDITLEYLTHLKKRLK